MAREVKFYITDTNNFFKKLCSLTNLPNNIILCSADVVGLYPNIPHDEDLSDLQKKIGIKERKKSKHLYAR